MPLTRINPTTVRDDSTGSTFYFPEDPAGQGPSRPPTGDPWWAAPQMDIGQAVIEPPPDVQLGNASIEPDAPNFNGPPPPGAGPMGDQGTPRSPAEIQAAIAAADAKFGVGQPPPSPDTVSAAGPVEPRALAAAPAAGSPSGAAPQLSAPTPRGRSRVPHSLDEVAQLYDEAAAQQQTAAAGDYLTKRGLAGEEAQGAKDAAAQEAQFAVDYDKAMQRAQREAEGRWNDWKSRYDKAANSQINPENYWSSRTTFQKAMWLLSVAAHAWTQDKFGGKNVALGMLQGEIDRDIGAQGENKKNQMDALRGESDYLKGRDQLGKSALEDRATAHALRLRSLQRGLEARMKALGPAAADADYAGALAALANDEAKVGSGLYSAYHKEAQDRAELGLKYAQLAAKKKEAAPPVAPDIHPRLGVTAFDAAGNPVPVKLRARSDAEMKETGKAANDLIANANEEHTMMLRLRNALSDQGTMDVIRGSRGDVKAAASRLAYQIAKVDNGSRPTDKDVEAALVQITGQEGLGAWSALKTPGAAIDQVDSAIKRHRVKTENQLYQYVDPTNARVVWEPPALEVGNPGPRSPEDTRAELGGRYGGDTGTVPRRTQPLNPYGPESDTIYRTEKAAGKLPQLSPDEDAALREFGLAADEAAGSGDLKELDRVIRTAETSGKLSQEARARLTLDLRRLRVETSRRLAGERRAGKKRESDVRDEIRSTQTPGQKY